MIFCLRKLSPRRNFCSGFRIVLLGSNIQPTPSAGSFPTTQHSASGGFLQRAEHSTCDKEATCPQKIRPDVKGDGAVSSGLSIACCPPRGRTVLRSSHVDLGVFLLCLFKCYEHMNPKLGSINVWTLYNENIQTSLHTNITKTKEPQHVPMRTLA